MDKWRPYLAGLIDGEGCIDIHLTRNKTPNHKYEYYDLRLRIAMTTEEPIKTMEALFGGCHSVTSKGGNRRAIHELCWIGDKALVLLELMQPYLILKRKHADLAIEYRKFCNKYRKFGSNGTPQWVMDKRREYYRKMRCLNERGKKALAPP